LKDIKESWEKEYYSTMGNGIGKFKWETFAKVKYPEEKSYW